MVIIWCYMEQMSVNERITWRVYLHLICRCRHPPGLVICPIHKLGQCHKIYRSLECLLYRLTVRRHHPPVNQITRRYGGQERGCQNQDLHSRATPTILQWCLLKKSFRQVLDRRHRVMWPCLDNLLSQLTTGHFRMDIVYMTDKVQP